MGGGRAPCCDKSKVNRGPWSPAEDFTLISFIQNHGHPNWRSLPKQAGLLRCGKSCRSRWINYLRPDLKRGNFTIEEEETISKLHQSLGNKWSKISSYLPGRTDNEIKNVWNTHLKKRLMIKKDRDDNETKQFSKTSSPSSSSISFMPPCGNHDTQKGTKEGDEPKEASFSSSSVSSYASDYWDPNGFDIAMPENELGTLFQVPCEIDDAVYEANNRSTLNSDGHDQVVIEVPFESDIDLWGMLDNLDTLQSNEYTETLEFEAWQDSDFGEDLQYDWEINECSKCFKTLGK